MARTRRWRVAFGAVLVVALLGGCAGPDDVVEVPLATLAAEPYGFEGRMIATRGVVRGVDEPRHFWIEDDDFNRVQLLPDDLAAPLVGRSVRVVGRFERGDRGGRVLHVRELEPR